MQHVATVLRRGGEGGPEDHKRTGDLLQSSLGCTNHSSGFLVPCNDRSTLRGGLVEATVLRTRGGEAGPEDHKRTGVICSPRWVAQFYIVS